MTLLGIAAVLLALAADLCGVAVLLRVLGIKVREPERELTEEEKRALESQIEANRKWSVACDSLVFGVTPGGNGT